MDFTDAKHVGSAHAYFEGDSLKNPKVKAFFKSALQGERAEQEVGLPFDASANLFRVP